MGTVLKPTFVLRSTKYMTRKKTWGPLLAAKPLQKTSGSVAHVVMSANDACGPVAVPRHNGAAPLLNGLLAADVRSKVNPSHTT